MSAEHQIPPAFRDALDEPAPPAPPDVEPERGDDDGHHHVFLKMPVPIFAVYGDWSVVANEWRGTLIQGWCWGASLVTATLIGQGIWGWIAGDWRIGYRNGLFIGALTVVAALVVIVLTGCLVLHQGRFHRFWAVVMLMAAMFLLSVMIVRAWLP